MRTISRVTNVELSAKLAKAAKDIWAIEESIRKSQKECPREPLMGPSLREGLKQLWGTK